MRLTVAPQAKRHIGQILIDQGILTEDQLRIALLEQTKQQPGRPAAGAARLRLRGDAARRAVREARPAERSISRSIIVDPVGAQARCRATWRAATASSRWRSTAQQKKFIVALADTNNIVALDQMRAHLQAASSRSSCAWPATRRSSARSSNTTATSSRSTASCTRSRPARSTTRACSRRRRRILAAGGAPDLGAARRRGGARRLGHPLRARAELPAHPLPHRRRAAPDPRLHKTYWPAMAVRLKVMAKMNIAETRAPQDGRISLTLSGRAVDFRVVDAADDARREHRAAHPRPRRRASCRSTSWACERGAARAAEAA